MNLKLWPFNRGEKDATKAKQQSTANQTANQGGASTQQFKGASSDLRADDTGLKVWCPQDNTPCEVE